MNIQDCLKYSIHNCEELFETPLGKAFENLNNQGIKAYMNCGWERKESLDIITGDNYCLLYTSPSPRDATLSRMPSSA